MKVMQRSTNREFTSSHAWSGEKSAEFLASPRGISLVFNIVLWVLRNTVTDTLLSQGDNGDQCSLFNTCYFVSVFYTHLTEEKTEE